MTDVCSCAEFTIQREALSLMVDALQRREVRVHAHNEAHYNRLADYIKDFCDRVGLPAGREA